MNASAPARPATFEGAYRDGGGEVRPDSRFECKICWWVYDPALGDAQWQVPAGTAFTALPSHWCCPNCDGQADQFLLLPDPGAAA